MRDYSENEDNEQVNDQLALDPTAVRTKTVTIKPVNFAEAQFKLIAATEVPLVIHRFSHKLKMELKLKAETGKPASSKKTREPKDSEATYNAARYISREDWDGFQASCIRNAAISACRLCGFKMVLAKLSIFCLKEGVDKTEPQIPLIQIHGEPVRQEDMAKVEGGQPYVTIRPAYWDWWAMAHLRYDADQFELSDLTNLLVRVGMQVGIGEGRPDSPKSAGMGWGLFNVEGVGNGLGTNRKKHAA
jgi:hypothetical protein